MLRYLALSFVCVACGTSSDPAAAPPPAGDPPPDLDMPAVIARPYERTIPTTYSEDTPMPLVIALHGLGWNGPDYVQALGLPALAEEHGFLLAYPDGSPWQGSCCAWNSSFGDLFSSGVDDVHYLRAVIADMRLHYAVDPARIYVQGISNGGFMAHVLACMASDRIAAISSIAGTFWSAEMSRCQPEQPVAINHTHGTEDDTVLYDGGVFYNIVSYVGAEDAVAEWREVNGCTAYSIDDTVDADDSLAGAETDVQRWGGGDAPVELWKINGAGHIPDLNQTYLDSLVAFFLDNARD
jgi:polyhydroxybutyrate depolymerase